MGHSFFLQFWQRRSSVHSFHWNTHTYCTLDEIHHTYHGTDSIDPVTDQPTVYYPAWKRRLWYLFSFLAMLPLLSGGVAIMTLSLNLNGYVRDKHSPIYVGWLSQYAEPVSGQNCISVCSRILSLHLKKWACQARGGGTSRPIPLSPFL